MEVAPGDWDALLARLGLTDVYLTRAYLESALWLERGEPVLLAGGETVFPCILRDFQGHADVTAAYGYGGPVSAGGDAEAFYSAYEDWCSKRGVVSTFVRFHPLYANHRYARIPVEVLGWTIAWRLDVEDLFAEMHAHHRRVVRKAERGGLEVAVDESPALDEFTRLYERTMARLDADSFYLFTPEYWASLTALPCLLVSARREGELIAAVLCFASKPWLHYHLGASSDEGRRLGASNLVLYEAARWARERGYERFHLGGGLGGREDSLYEFKRRFDPGGELEFAVGRGIHDEATYRELAGGTDAGGFFPAYRDTSS